MPRKLSRNKTMFEIPSLIIACFFIAAAVPARQTGGQAAGGAQTGAAQPWVGEDYHVVRTENMPSPDKPPVAKSVHDLAPSDLGNADQMIRDHLAQARQNFNPNDPKPTSEHLFKATEIMRFELANMLQRPGQDVKELLMHPEAFRNRGASVTQGNEFLTSDFAASRTPHAVASTDAGQTSPSTRRSAAGHETHAAMLADMTAPQHRLYRAISQFEEFDLKVQQGGIKFPAEFLDPYDRIYKALTVYHYENIDAAQGWPAAVPAVPAAVMSPQQGEPTPAEPPAASGGTPVDHVRQAVEYFKGWADLHAKPLDTPTQDLLRQLQTPPDRQDERVNYDRREAIARFGELLKRSGFDVTLATQPRPTGRQESAR